MNYKTGLKILLKESLSKTLRNALIPTESTKIHMEEMGSSVMNCEQKNNRKEIMDDYYRAFIEENLVKFKEYNGILIPKMEETMEDI